MLPRRTIAAMVFRASRWTDAQTLAPRGPVAFRGVPQRPHLAFSTKADDKDGASSEEKTGADKAGKSATDSDSTKEDAAREAVEAQAKEAEAKAREAVNAAGQFFSDFKAELFNSKGKTETGASSTPLAGGAIPADTKENLKSLGERLQSATASISGKVSTYLEGDNQSWQEAAQGLFGGRRKKATAPKENWYEAVDEKTGETYYYNDEGETTWERPARVVKTPEQEAHEWAEKQQNATPEPSFLEEQIKELASSIPALEEKREEAMANSDMKLFKELNKNIRDVRKEIEKLSERAHSTAVVEVEERKGAWEQFSEGIRGSDMLKSVFGIGEKVGAADAARKVKDATEDAREYMETSQNPLVYSAYSMWDSIFAENEMGEALREIRKLEPDFSLEEFAVEAEEDIIPLVLGAFLRGDKQTLVDSCSEAAAAATGSVIDERERQGMTVDPNILAISEVNVASAQLVDKLGPLVLITFMAQQIDCLYDKSGKVAEGYSDDNVAAVYYAFAMGQEYDEEAQEVKWIVKEFAIIGNNPYL